MRDRETRIKLILQRVYRRCVVFTFLQHIKWKIISCRLRMARIRMPFSIRHEHIAAQPVWCEINTGRGSLVRRRRRVESMPVVTGNYGLIFGIRFSIGARQTHRKYNFTLSIRDRWYPIVCRKCLAFGERLKNIHTLKVDSINGLNEWNDLYARSSGNLSSSSSLPAWPPRDVNGIPS